MEEMKRLAWKYFAGETETAEETKLSDFIMDSDGNAAMFDEWRREWAEKSATFVHERDFRKVKARIEGKRRLRIIVVSLSSVAAAALVAFVALGLSGMFRNEPVEPKLFCESTDYQQKRSIELADGSIIHLNSGTSVTYDEGFNNTNRNIKLVGEAYFEVAKNPKLPFTVQANGTEVKVIGTKFNVCAYGTESKVVTSLLEGSVMFAAGNSSIGIRPGDIVTYDVNLTNIVKCHGDVKRSIAWMNGKLDFDNISLGELLDRLSSLYGVHFIYTREAWSEKPVRIILNDTEPLENILDAVSVIAPIRWKIDGDTIIVRER